jgi:hypothetical protein
LKTQQEALAAVSEQMKAYAHRGVFRSFHETRRDRGQTEFRFHWLWNLPFHLAFDSKRGELSFEKLLPNVLLRSKLETELRGFLKSRCSSSWPEHRRLDPKRVSIRYSNRRSTVSLTFRVAGSDYDYAVKKSLNVVNEVLACFLNVYFPEYMVKNFRLPDE